MEELVKIFGIDWHLILAQVVNFAIVFAVIYYFAYKPVISVVSERQQKIEKGLEDSKQAAIALLESQKKSEDIISKAKKEASQLLSKANDAIVKNREEEISKTKNETARMIADHQKELEKAKEKIMIEIKGEVADLVVKSVEKVVGLKMHEINDTKLVEEILSKQ